MKRPMVLFSGGVDSTVLAWRYRAAGPYPMLALVDYGQRHAVELTYARQIAESFGFSSVLLTVPWGDQDSTKEVEDRRHGAL